MFINPCEQKTYNRADFCKIVTPCRQKTYEDKVFKGGEIGIDW